MRNKLLLKSITAVLFFIILFLAGCSKEKPKPETQIPKPNQFGLFVADLIEVCDTIEVNQTLSDILQPHSVSLKLIHELEKKSLHIFPLRSLEAGKEIFIYAKWDSVETVKYIVYKDDPINFVVFDLRDSINIYKKQKPSTIQEVTASGVIESSLWDTFESRNISWNLGAKIEDIYSCQFDFFSIQPGDSFKVLYQQIIVEGEPVSIGKVLAGNFYHYKQNYFAFYFDKEKGGGYFDEKGGSLKKMFLKAPLKFFSITSRYSLKRFHPILRRSRAHLGTDYAAPTGTPIMSVGNGLVIDAGYSGGNGNYVKIKHNRTYTTQYLHMSRFAKGIRKGVPVIQGQVIGYVGSTGLATGPHVCFRFWKNNTQVNPLREKYQSAEPVSKNNKADFEITKNELMKRLNDNKLKYTSLNNQSNQKAN